MDDTGAPSETGRVRENNMEFNTSEFEFAHGRKPKGVGMWAFEFVGTMGEQGTSRWRVEYAPGTLPFGEAKKWARARAKELNCNLVRVCS